MYIHHDQAHGGVFERSRSITHRNGQQSTSGNAAAVYRESAFQHARLALITRLFAFLSLICLDPTNSAAAVVLSAVKVATAIYEHGVKSDRIARRTHHD
jgi:hypothetical protein